MAILGKKLCYNNCAVSVSTGYTSALGEKFSQTFQELRPSLPQFHCPKIFNGSSLKGWKLYYNFSWENIFPTYFPPIRYFNSTLWLPHYFGLAVFPLHPLFRIWWLSNENKFGLNYYKLEKRWRNKDRKVTDTQSHICLKWSWIKTYLEVPLHVWISNSNFVYKSSTVYWVGIFFLSKYCIMITSLSWFGCMTSSSSSSVSDMII